MDCDESERESEPERESDREDEDADCDCDCELVDCDDSDCDDDDEDVLEDEPQHGQSGKMVSTATTHAPLVQREIHRVRAAANRHGRRQVLVYHP